MNKYCCFKKGERFEESQAEEYELERIELSTLWSLRKILVSFVVYFFTTKNTKRKTQSSQKLLSLVEINIEPLSFNIYLSVPKMQLHYKGIIFSCRTFHYYSVLRTNFYKAVWMKLKTNNYSWCVISFNSIKAIYFIISNNRI